MPYIGKSPSAGVRQRYQYTATASQTTFSGTDLGNLTLTYTDNNFVDVFQNGVLLKGGGTDYTATSGTSVVLTTGASVSDVIEIIVYDVFSVGNFFNRTDSDSRYYKHSLGEELILDADADTSITADTDDQIDFKTGGSDRVTIDSSGNFIVGRTSSSTTTVGAELRANGKVIGVMDGGNHTFNRLTSDGDIVKFQKDGTEIGSIGCQSGTLVMDGPATKFGIRMGSGALIPRDNGSDTDNANDIGTSSNRFDDIHAGNGTIITSDRQEKNTITDSDLGLDFVNRLSPKSYIFNGKTRTHYGLIAQDVETVLSDINKETSEFAGFIKSDISEEQDGSQYRYGLRYTEFVGILIKALQEADDKIDALTARVTALEGE